MQNVDELADWLKGALARLEDSSEASILIRQNDAESGHPTVEEVLYQQSTGTLQAYAESIASIAQRDARGIGGGSYIIEVEGVKARFTMNFEDVAHAGSDSDEPSYREGQDDFQNPNMRSAWALQLEHNQKFAKNLLESVAFLKSMMIEQHQTIQVMSKERVGTINAYAELVDGRHTRDLEMKRIERSEERREQTFKMLSPVAGAVVAKVLGPMMQGMQGPPGEFAPPPIVEQAVQTFGTMTQDQIKKIMESKIFTHEQMEGLLQFLSSLSDMQEKPKVGETQKENSQ